MTSVILLIKDIFEFNVIPDKILNDKNIKKFTFDFNVHEILKNKKIEHEIADNLLTEEDRLKIFNQMLEFRKWYSTVTSKDLEFENVNILKLFDTHEFSSYLMPNLINFILIKEAFQLLVHVNTIFNLFFIILSYYQLID